MEQSTEKQPGRPTSNSQSATVESGHDPPKPKIKRSIGKRLLFFTVAALLVTVLLEIATRIIIGFSDQNLANLRKRQKSVADQQRDDSTPSEVMHPYLGWVINPDAKQEKKVNPLGFIGNVKVIGKRHPGTMRIAIVGGSVALGLAESSSELITKKLKDGPQVKGRDVQVVPLAMSGYKQPQQLLQLSYLMSLGAEFDVVINIDGYNEIALHGDDNGEANVFYAYPQAWHGRMVGVMDPVRVERTFRVFELKVARIRLAKWIMQRPYRYSALLNVYWSWRDESLKTKLLDQEVEVIKMRSSEGLGYHITGPGHMNSSGIGSLKQLADLWMNSSVQIHRVCKSNGTIYLHFLQPNQYVVGSKNLSDKERNDFIVADQGYGKSVKRGYPLLSDRGKTLAGRGVRFHDLTNLFLKTPETVYSDYFCHLNKRGNELLATRIVEELIRVLEAAKAPPPRLPASRR